MPTISAISSTSSSIAPSSSAISRSNSRECPSRRYLSFATCSARACPMNHGVHARSSSSPDGVSFVVVHRGGQSDNRLRAFSSPDGRRWMRARARRERAWGAARRDASDADARAGTSTTERVFAIDVRARRARALDIRWVLRWVFTPRASARWVLRRAVRSSRLFTHTSNRPHPG